MGAISQTGLDLIKKWEGLRLSAYKDAGGTWTIGYGHTAGVAEGDTITQEQAEQYLKEDVKTAVASVNNRDANGEYNFNQNQFDALCSFAFNLGAGNLQKLTAYDTRTISEISEKILLYNKCNGKTLTGLVNRRAEEKELFDTPVKAEYYPSVPYNGILVDMLKKAGETDTSYSHRCVIALANGFLDYRGSADQNIEMCRLLRDGKLLKA